MPKQNNLALTLEQRQAVRSDLHNRFEEQHPHYVSEGDAVQLPPAKKPASLANVDISKKQMAQVPIPEPQKSVICGSILGDSSISIDSGYANARVANRHSTRQFDWFFWKWLVCLKDFINGLGTVQVQNPDGYQAKTPLLPGETFLGKLRVVSKACPQLTALRVVVCDNAGKKSIERNWLNHMTDYFLMTLWCDDGSLMHRNQGVISLESTPSPQLEILRDYLRKVWGVETRLERSQQSAKSPVLGYRLAFVNQDNLLKFLRIVAPIIPVKSMLNKVLFVPTNNPDLLQRWATELEGLVLPQFREDVRKFYLSLN